MVEIVLDPSIRFWVFLPIVVITLLFGILKHYIMVLMSSEKKPTLQQITDSQALLRSAMLREHGGFLPQQSFMARKHYFNNNENGYFKQQENRDHTNAVRNPMMDPTMMVEQMKGNVLNLIPMLVIGGWIHFAFSGFLTTKIPFPLTYRFKGMLQQGVDLASLDASWVSSASWYFLNIFGLRSMYSLILGADNRADQTRAMQDQMMGPMQQQQDPTKAFKAERESLEMVHHRWMLAGIEDSLTGRLKSQQFAVKS